MGSINISTPSRAYLQGFSPSELERCRGLLQYIDKRIDFELQRLKKNRYAVHEMGIERYNEAIADLKLRRKGCVLQEDPVEGPWIPSGLAQKVSKHFLVPIQMSYVPPQARSVPWALVPKHPPRPYQLEAVQKLLEGAQEGGPRAVSLATGLGKTYIQMLVAKELALRTVLMCPSTSIARQTFDEFKLHFGGAKVGLFGDGRKDLGKLFTICIDDSLVNVEPGTDAFEWFSGAQVFMADESHLTPAKTLRDVCYGLLANAPYRFFFSGTQFRNDGLDLVLEGIVGPIVLTMTVRDGVAGGYLAQPVFTMFEVLSKDGYTSDDPIKMTRRHFYYNPAVLQKAADLINQSVNVLNKPTLVLIEEVEQFTALLPLLNVKCDFAHGPLIKGKNGKPGSFDKVPEAYRKSDNKKLVASFNDKQLLVLIGTSCIATGTDIRPTEMLINLRAKASEIATRQGVGRGTRLAEGKTVCHVIDFRVSNVHDLQRHADERAAIYDDIFGPVREVPL